MKQSVSSSYILVKEFTRFMKQWYCITRNHQQNQHDVQSLKYHNIFIKRHHIYKGLRIINLYLYCDHVKC